MTNWESVSAPRGAGFVGWGGESNIGQHVTGKVLHVGTGSKPNNAGPCPELTIELSEDTYSLRKGERVDLRAGETVTLTAAQYQLERDISAAQLAVGDMIKVTLQGVSKTRSGNTVKDFDVQIARGAAPTPASQQPAQPAQQSFGGIQAAAPF